MIVIPCTIFLFISFDGMVAKLMENGDQLSKLFVYKILGPTFYVLEDALVLFPS